MNECQECSRLRVLLKAYLAKFPAFRSKPIGAPYSKERNQQQEHIALEDLARTAFTGASDETPEQQPVAWRIRNGVGHWDFTTVRPHPSVIADCQPLYVRTSLKALPAPREWHFDRYRNGKLMAEGVVVRNKATFEEALEWARCQYPPYTDTFKLRDEKNGSEQ